MRAVLWEFAVYSNKISPAMQLETLLVTLSKVLVPIASGNTMMSKKDGKKVKELRDLFAVLFFVLH